MRDSSLIFYGKVCFLLQGFKVAYVVFKKKSGVFKAKKLSTSNVKCMSAAATEVKTGIASMFGLQFLK